MNGFKRTSKISAVSVWGRRGLLSAGLWVLCFSLSASEAAESTASSGPTDTLTKLPDGLNIRRQFSTFDTIVQRTGPTFVWDGHDMTWISSDASGKPVFAMNRAYDLKLGGGGSASY
jgi:hypothetical protein